MTKERTTWNQLTVEELWEHFEYHPGQGRLIWKKPLSRKTKVGDIASYVNKSDGYRHVRYRYGQFQEHRLIWFMHTGEWPKSLDHWDDNRQNNTLDNLRPTTYVLNNFHSFFDLGDYKTIDEGERRMELINGLLSDGNVTSSHKRSARKARQELAARPVELKPEPVVAAPPVSLTTLEPPCIPDAEEFPIANIVETGEIYTDITVH